MSSTANIAVLILAAGGSKRMGVPKQLLPWGKATLLNHAVDTAFQLQHNKLAVVLGAYSEEIKETIINDTVLVFEHAQWEDGLGTSIAWGVSQLLASTSNLDGVLILLADQPMLQPNYLNEVIRTFEPEKQQIVATAYDDQKKGVPALFDASYFHELATLKGDKGAKEILQKHITKVQLLTAEGQLSDIDTLEDYRSLYSANHQ